MADAAVDFLLENLQQLLLYDAHLIGDAKNLVEKLESDLRLFKAFLKDSTNKRRKDESLRELVRQIRDVVYEVEDIIDALVTQAVAGKSRNYHLRAFPKPVNIITAVEKVESILRKISIYRDKLKLEFASLDVGDEWPEEPKASIVREHSVVGIEDEVEKLLGYLTVETQHLDVISIIGMPGLGKTTLAGKIFCHPAIQYEFHILIWVYISHEFTRKDVFLAILRKFITLTEDVYQRTDHELAQLIASLLDNRKFLIVMDDVWTAEDWDRLQIALPKGNKMGKILITSQNVGVARHANHCREPHLLRFLTPDESWLLLCLEVFGKPNCPAELEDLGKLIVDQCGGLPLALVIIGGILVKKSSASDEMSTKVIWEKISHSVVTYLNEDPQRRMERIISLSYDKLHFHLRACFLYFGMFPEDFEIPVSKLIMMWIAEGFIQQKGNGVSLEETAENYLEELISRNLVRNEKIKLNGKAKTCRIHNMLQNFCKIKGGVERENLVQEIKKSNEGLFEPPVCDVHKYRRLCIHSSVSHFLSSKPFGPRVRSFVCFSKGEIDLPPEICSSIPAAFKLLKVLDVVAIKFTRIPSDLYSLIHLRYIALSFKLSILPPAFAKLWNIQTLIVDTTCRTLEIKADIWQLKQLRCLKTNASAILPKTGKSSKYCDKLRTLGTISPHNCTEEVFDRARNLKRLGICGRLSFLMDDKAGTFDSLRRLSNLEKLKLINDVFPSPPSEGRLHSLPQPYKFPPKLRSLTLAHTFLDWSLMSILGFLENLEVLKLKDKAFMGQLWVVSDGGFCNLEVLHIGRTNLVHWKASGHQFPKLRRLELQNCERLEEVPIGLADIPSLQQLTLWSSKSAIASAKKIYEKKILKTEDEQTTRVTVLHLSIFPADY